MCDEISVSRYFTDAGYELIPSLSARSIPGGVVTESAFKYILNEILSCLPEGRTVDGVWMHLHGAMIVENVGSGEAALVREIRKKVGGNVPISIALDLHACITEELLQEANIICGYRTAPHIDVQETEMRSAKLLIECMQKKLLPRPVFVRVPLLIPGEASTTDVEPMKSLIGKIKELENSGRILSASVFIGMAWIDSPNACVSVIMIPADEQAIARSFAKKIAEEIWNRRTEFKLHCKAEDSENALIYAESLVRSGKYPVFITDSGDNVTAGAAGSGITLLKHAYKRKTNRILFAGILNKEVVDCCRGIEAGEILSLNLKEADQPAESFVAEGTLKWKGEIFEGGSSTATKAVLVDIKGIMVSFVDRKTYFICPEQIENTGSKIKDHEIIVVKQGYLFPELQKVAADSILALTHGTTSLDLSAFKYQTIKAYCDHGSSIMYVDFDQQSFKI